MFKTLNRSKLSPRKASRNDRANIFCAIQKSNVELKASQLNLKLVLDPVQ